MPRPLETYLDIETTWDGELTVVGFRSSFTGVVQLVGRDITAARLSRELPRAGRLFTYNGHSFDLPCIRRELGLDLRDRFESRDLRWICQRHGLRGGQKAIEHQIGLTRRTDGLDGHDAIHLWAAYEQGDESALRTLLRYNADDLIGLVRIKRHLEQMEILE